MKKRVLAIMLACLMLVSLLPAGVLAAESEIKCPGLGEDHYLSNATPVKGSEEVVEGLCGGYDYVVYTCAGCGDKFADNFEKVDGEHDYDVIDEPTCEEEGKKECSICGASKAIEATGHDWEVAGEIVDCTAPMKCANCGEEKEGDAHAWAGTPEIVVKPDESTWTDGLATYSCTVDGCDATKEVVIKCSHVCKDNLKWVKKKAPTCEEDGYRGHYVCTICGNYFNTNKNPIDSVIRPATGHVAPEQEDIASGEALAQFNGLRFTVDADSMVIITVDKDFTNPYTTESVPVVVFDTATWEEIAKVYAGETLTLPLKAGEYELWCDGIGEVSYAIKGFILDAPTCTESGSKTYICTVCGEVAEEELEPKHEWEIKGEAEADCTHNGYIYMLCRRCDVEPIMEVYPMLGHSTYEEVLASEDGVIETLDPTCNNDGYIRWYCLRCGELAGETVLEAVGCTEVTITKPATCVKYAYSYTICTNECHEGDKVSFVNNYYENEFTEGGMKAERNGIDVTVDGEPVFITSTLDFYGLTLGYVIVDVEGGFNGDITAHNRDDMREGIVNEPTCTEMGLSVYICSDCQKHVVEKLPTIEHDYEAFVIEPMCGNFGYTKYICTMCEDEYVDEESIVAPLPLDYQFESLEAADAVHGELFFIESFRDATCDSDLVGLLKYGCADCGKNVLVIDSTGGKHVPGDLPAFEDAVFVEIGAFNDVIYAGENTYGGAYYATEIPFSFATVAYADDIFVFTAPKAGKLIFEFGENVPSKSSILEYDEENDIYFLNVKADRDYEINLWGEDYSVKVYFEGERPESHDVQIFAGKEATCTEPGYSAQYVCTRCGAFVESVPTEPAHDWEITVEAVPPTCTEAGCTEGKECKICDAVVESEELAALGHTYGDFEIVDERAWTELEDNAGSLFGYQHIEYTCETCGDVVEQIINYVDGCEHVWSEEFDEEASKEPKCCEEGYLAYRCLFCDAYHYEKLDMIHHANKDGVELSNCAVDQTGVEDRICDCCGEEIPVPEHAWDEGKEYDATCTTYGYILYCCTNEGCEATYVVEIDTPYTDHDFAFDAFVYEDYTTKEVIIGIAYKCKNCDETMIEDYDGIAFITEIANKIEEAGETITDGNTIKVTISLAGLEDALWGFELDVKYSNNLKFLSGKFVDGANFAGHVYNKDGVISIAGNHIDSSKDYALDGREAVVELYFEVNQEKAGEVAIDVEIVDIANYAGEDVDGIANDATAKTVELMELDGKEGITVFDVLEAFKLMNAEDYNVAADLNKNGEIDALDIAYMYQYMIEQLTYKQIRALK